MMRMPRKDYFKYFSRDAYGVYTGTEPDRDWSEEDVELMFGKYKLCERPNWVIANKGGGMVLVEEEEEEDWEKETLCDV